MYKQLPQDDKGAQVGKYALIVDMAAVGRCPALQPLMLAVGFCDFIARIGPCLTTAACV